jgi:DNA-binding PadR family transcriptional regulator
MSKAPFKVTAATLDVLECFLAGGEDLYALKIAKTIGRPSGSVVPILMRLQQHGWVTSEWETSTEQARGPRRRFYLLDANHLSAASALVASRRPSAQARFRPSALGLEGA